MSEITTERSKGYMTFLIIFMGLVALIDQYLNLIEGTAIPYIVEEFWLTPIQIQTLLTKMGFSTISQFTFWQGVYSLITLSVFLINWSSDAIGRKKGIIILLLFMGIPALMVALTPPASIIESLTSDLGFHWFMVLYGIMIMATLSNLWEVPITEEAPPKRRALYGAIVFFIGLIPIYSFLGPVIARSLGWRWLYGIMFFFMIGAVVLSLFMKETERWKKEHEKRGGEFLTFKACVEKMTRTDKVYIMVFSLVYFIWNVGYKFAVIGGGSYYMIVRGVSVETWSSIYLIVGLMTIVGAILAGFLMEKVGRNKTLTIGTIGSVVAFILLGLTGMPVFLWCVGLFLALLLGWIMIYFSEIFPTEYRGTCIGIINTLSRVGYVVGPILTSVLITLFPEMQMFWIAGGLIMLTFLVAILIKPYETKAKTLEEIEAER
ncbi:MAG: nitrate/nitrite transporter [Promethearchaeota archaeon]